MTTRNPLVRISGKIIELPAGDVLGGAAQGPPGLVWQGAWSALISYVVDDVVSNNGSAWVAIAPSTNQAPPTLPTTSNAYWQLLASKGDTGATGATGSTGATGPAGTPGTGLGQIAQVIASGSPASIDFSSIPSTYTNLQLWFSGRDTANITAASMFMRVNNDTTSGNYSKAQYVAGGGASDGGTASTIGTGAPSSNGAYVGNLPGSSGNANSVGSTVIFIPNYANTTFYKQMVINSADWYGAGPTQERLMITYVWKSTAAINRLTLFPGNTAFVNGSIATLYGMT